MGLRRLHRHLALLDGGSGHDARLELARAFEIRVRKLHLRLRLRDQASRLIDRRVGALGRRVVLRQERVELGAIEAGEHLPFLHPVAILGVEFDDREPVNAGRDLRFLARHQGARDEQPVDEFAFCRGNDGDRRRLDHARRFRRGLNRRRARGRFAGCKFVRERAGQGAWRDGARRPDAAKRGRQQP